MTKSKSSLRERLAKKKKEIKERGSGSRGIIFQKEGTIRARLLSTGDDNEFVFEITQFYLGPEVKGVISPASLGEPCAIMERYEELRESDDPDDKDLAKSFSPRKRYLAPVAVYSDLKGKKLDQDNSGKLIMITNAQYEKIIDLYLDNDEWGDMTQTDENGYDLKFIRSGTGQFDTEYDIQPCKNSPAPKGYKKDVDLEEMVREVIPTYEETVEAINTFLHGASDDEEEKPKKKKKKKKKSKDI